MDKSRIAASLAAAQDDVARIFQGYEVPDDYRSRLTAYIQCWYIDQGVEVADGARLCMLPGEEPAAEASRSA